jgi:hypothetical protein
MKRTLAALAICLLVSGAGQVFGSDLKTDTFQVTGTVSAMDDGSVTVMKGKERFHIARDKDTKTTGELKVGAKVTVQYRMSAASIEAKEDKAAKPAKQK